MTIDIHIGTADLQVLMGLAIVAVLLLLVAILTVAVYRFAKKRWPWPRRTVRK